MKNLILISYVLCFINLFSANLVEANDSCYRVLTHEYASDSSYFQYHADDLEVGDLELSNESIHEVMDRFFGAIGCDSKKERILKAVKCQSFSDEHPEASKICYLEIEEGYFSVSYDMMQNLNFVFHRWD